MNQVAKALVVAAIASTHRIGIDFYFYQTMNLYPTGSDPGGPLAPADWTMTIDSEKRGETAHFFADVRRDGVPVCRLAITGVISEKEAHRRLAVKARLWIDNYLSRPHSGNTEFGTLE